MRKYLLASLSLLALSACDLSPDFTLPEINAGSAFKEDVSVDTATVEPVTDGRWKRFDEKAGMDEFAWWRMFHNATLDALEEKAMQENPSLEAAMQRVASARALVQDRNAALYPSVGVGFGPERSRQSPAAQEPNLPPGTPPSVKPYTLYNARGTISYELDLFGRNLNRAQAARNDARAEHQRYVAARLSLQAEVAQTYFRLAALREEEKVLARAVATRSRFVELTQQKVDVGFTDALVLSSAQTDLATAQAEAASVTGARAASEHALAVLTGQPPSALTVDTDVLDTSPPSVPAGLPSSLLERRPDIHAAAESIAAANARIGIARSGYFPNISLSAIGGFTSGDLSELFNWSNRTWTIGPLAGTILTQPLFEGGRVAAARAQTDADYKAAVAEYRASVLQAFREVEDQLSSLQAASARMDAAQNGRAAALRAYEVGIDRYQAGYSSYLEYLDAERSKLNAERLYTQVRGEQYINTVQLVKALGGSWQAPVAAEQIGPMSESENTPETAPEAAAPAPAEPEAPVAEAPKSDVPNAANVPASAPTEGAEATVNVEAEKPVLPSPSLLGTPMESPANATQP